MRMGIWIENSYLSPFQVIFLLHMRQRICAFELVGRFENDTLVLVVCTAKQMTRFLDRLPMFGLRMRMPRYAIVAE